MTIDIYQVGDELAIHIPPSLASMISMYVGPNGTVSLLQAVPGQTAYESRIRAKNVRLAPQRCYTCGGDHPSRCCADDSVAGDEE